ncbi:MAG: hypothetical protein Q4B67_05930 [Eubacteriales bacterium]|nr:hypothetical protein [Eubacteriales bacterium]
MGLKFGDMMKMKGAWDRFCKGHPKFPMFLNAIRRKTVNEGTIISVSLEYPDGEKYATNLKVTAEDLELLRTLQEIKPE